MAGFEGKVSFHDMTYAAVDAFVSVADDHLAIEVSGRSIGRWRIDELSARSSGDSVVVTAEGEHLIIDVTDPDALRVSLRIRDEAGRGIAPAAGSSVDVHAPELPWGPEVHPALRDTPRRLASAAESDQARLPDAQREPAQNEREVDAVRKEISNLGAGLAAAHEQLRWVQELLPRRLPILLRAHESGLGVVQGVQLKERRPLPGSDGLQPWVVVDSGNVYVTDRRLVFSGVQDVEFEFGEIVKKGASRTGLLLGVSSRTQTHILAGPGERLAIVLTAAEKIARGVDATEPFREAINRLTSEIRAVEGRLEPLEGGERRRRLEPDQLHPARTPIT